MFVCVLILVRCNTKLVYQRVYEQEAHKPESEEFAEKFFNAPFLTLSTLRYYEQKLNETRVHVHSKSAPLVK